MYRLKIWPFGSVLLATLLVFGPLLFPAQPVQAQAVTYTRVDFPGYAYHQLPDGNFVVFQGNESLLLDGETLEVIGQVDVPGWFPVIFLPNGKYIARFLPGERGAPDGGALTLCTLAEGCPDPVTAENSLLGTNGRVILLNDGDFLVQDTGWTDPALAVTGAIRFCDGDSGCQGRISSENSLVGLLSGDANALSVTPLENGDYLVHSSDWDHGSTLDAGFITYCDGESGCRGVVSTENSLIGARAGDMVGSGGVRPLIGDGVAVFSPQWTGGGLTGAITYCGPETDCTGLVSAGNSRVGVPTERFDLYPLSTGGYVLPYAEWNAGTGAVTFCAGAGLCAGPVSLENSLTGSHPGDYVGAMGLDPTSGGVNGAQVLPNGDYVVFSAFWDHGPAEDAGAVTLCSGVTGCTGQVVSAQNSLVGTKAGDHVGDSFVTPLDGGGYAVQSTRWDNGTIVDAGAVTGCPAGGCTGPVTPQNSLVGSHAGDRVGAVEALPGGGYLVLTQDWDRGSLADAGAVTECGAEGCTGPITPENSLVGSRAGDRVGSEWVDILAGGSYTVSSPEWDRGSLQDAGAVTFCQPGSCAGLVISAQNSLVGSRAGDQVGFKGTWNDVVVPLVDGDYVVISRLWDRGSLVDAGAVTWCSGETGCRGEISEQNSLVGDAFNQMRVVNIHPLLDGDYLVSHWRWTDGELEELGAIAYCSGSEGCSGEISPANSLVGRYAFDNLGFDHFRDDYFKLLPDGGYLIRNTWVDHEGLEDPGGITLCPTEGCTGVIGPENTVFGEIDGGDGDRNYDILFFTLDPFHGWVVIEHWAGEKIIFARLGESLSDRTATQTTLAASPLEFVEGQELTLTATVSAVGGPPPGQVTFYQGGVRLGRAALDANGQAVFKTSALTPGTFNLTAYYEGNYNYEPSLSGPVTVVVGRADEQATTVTLTVSNDRPAPGERLRLAARVTAGAGPPAGQVSFHDGEALLGQAGLDASGEAVLEVTLGEGSHSLSARYPGGGGYAAGSSAEVLVLVGGSGSSASFTLYLPWTGR